jgi:outer membrane protein assembly factor BamD (BamD/ComL family)
MHHKRNIPYLLFILVLAGIIGCQPYRNFTTYFNVLYDARRHLEAYEEKVNEGPVADAAIATVTTHRWLDEEYETRRVSIRHNGYAPAPKLLPVQTAAANRSGNAKHLDSAIILGSKILADKNPSKYIEDALYIIGKAQFYKNDYSGAKRKFNELLFKFPETEYGPEVGMLLARTLVASKQLDTAESVIRRAVGVQTDNRTTIADVNRLYAELLAAKYPDSLFLAVNALKKAEEYSSDNDAAQLAFERGALLYLDSKWSEATEAFDKTISRATDEFLRGEAMIARAQALRRSYKFEDAKQQLENVLSKTRYGTTHPPAHLERAVTVEEEARASVKNRLKESGFKRSHYANVRAAYNGLDTTYRNISQAIMARSRFRQAELFREMGEYDSAARIANLIIGTKDFSTPEMNDLVNERMRALVRFADNKVVVDRVVKVERLFERSKQSGQTLHQMNERDIRFEAERNILGPRFRPDTPPTFTPEEEELVKEAMVEIRKRRESEGDPFSAVRIGDTLRFVDSLRFSGAKARYELGRAYETFEEPHLARDEYMLAVGRTYNVLDTPKVNFQAQTYFAWIQLEDMLKNFGVRDSLITLLITRYGETAYAGQAVRLYGGKRGATSPGENAYAAAYEPFRRNGLSAKPGMLNVALNYSHEDVAPRALYAIGLAFEEANHFDSAVVYYRRVLGSYPYSPYAELLRPRLTAASTTQPAVIKQEAKVKPGSINSHDPGTQEQSVDKPRMPRIPEEIEEIEEK